MVGEASSMISVWLSNIGTAIHILESWHASAASPVPLDELRHLENRLQQANFLAQRLLPVVNAPPPVLPPEVLERIEAAVQADDKTEYLDAETFLTRMRARKGA
jgi:hypothetical protein